MCFTGLASYVTNPSEESVEKAPDHKKASTPAKTKQEPKETPILPPESGFVLANLFCNLLFWSYRVIHYIYISCQLWRHVVAKQLCLSDWF